MLLLQSWCNVEWNWKHKKLFIAYKSLWIKVMIACENFSLLSLVQNLKFYSTCLESLTICIEQLSSRSLSPTSLKFIQHLFFLSLLKKYFFDCLWTFRQQHLTRRLQQHSLFRLLNNMNVKSWNIVIKNFLKIAINCMMARTSENVF